MTDKSHSPIQAPSGGKTEETARLKIVIPDGPPEKQIKQIEDWIFIAKTMSKLTGEEDKLDLSDLYAKIEVLKKQL